MSPTRSRSTAIAPFVALAALMAVPAARPSRAQEPTPPAAGTPAGADAPPAPDERPKSRLVVGPEFGVFLPVNGKTGDAFGEAWTNLGIGVGRVRQADPRGAFAFEFQVLRNRRSGGSRALLLPLTVTYRRGLLPPLSEGRRRNNGPQPYVGVGTGLYLADLRSEKYGVTSGFRGALGVTALAGVTAGNRARFEARYLAVGRVKGFDLSGFSLAAGLRF